MKYSKKLISIGVVDGMRSLADDQDLQMLFVTPYGIITADVKPFETTDDIQDKIKEHGSAAVDLSLVHELREAEIEEAKKQDSEADFVSDGGMINLSNVKVYTSDFQRVMLQVNTMILFSDQVIAVSLTPRR